MRTAALNDSSPYLRYNVSECFEYYSDYFTPQGNGLIFVKNQSAQLEQPTSNNSVLLWVSVIPRKDNWAKNLWAVENGSYTAVGMKQEPEAPVTTWYLGKPQYEVDHCLLQQTPWPRSEEKCQLQYSPWILWVVCKCSQSCQAPTPRSIALRPGQFSTCATSASGSSL